MADSTYDILVRTRSDNSGIDSATAALGKASGATGENEKQTLHLGNAHRDLHRAMHQVTEQSPLLGLAVRAALNPIGATIGAAMLIFKQFNDHLKETNRLFDEMAAAAAAPIGNMKESMREANEEMRKQHREYQVWLTELRGLQIAVADSLGENLEKLHAETEATEKLAVAMVRAKVIMGPDKGGMTEAQGTVAESRITGTLRGETAQKTFDMTAEALRSVSEQKLRLADIMTRLEANANDPTRAGLIKDVPKRISGEEGNVKTYDDQAKAQQKKVEKAAAAFAEFDEIWMQKGDGFNAAKEKLKKETDEYDRLTGVRDANKRIMDRERESLERLNAEQTEASRRFKLAEDDMKALVARFDELSKTLESARIKLSVEPANKEADKLNLFKEVSGGAVGGAAKSDMLDAIRISARIQAGKGAFGSETQELISVASKIAGHTVDMKTAMGMMNWAAKDIGNFSTDMLRLVDAMGTLASALPTIKRKLDFVESQVANLKATLPGSH